MPHLKGNGGEQIAPREVTGQAGQPNRRGRACTAQTARRREGSEVRKTACRLGVLGESEMPTECLKCSGLGGKRCVCEEGDRKGRFEIQRSPWSSRK